MKLAISNIAFEAQDDIFYYEKMREMGFSGLEIAPTRIIPEAPYENCGRIEDFAKELYADYGLKIASMQSIWFGISQRMFDSEDDRRFLADYTKKAVDFAKSAGCPNLVFGCPRNRAGGNGDNYKYAVEFFKEVGDYAALNSTCVSIEANPPIYNTDFINNDNEALKLYNDVSSRGFKINLDMGTMIHNGEAVKDIDFSAVNHVHLSEPGLVEIEKRDLHRALADAMRESGYYDYVSIEMKKGLSREKVIEIMKYAKDVFS